MRPARVRIDLARLRANFQIICSDKPATLDFACVVKDNAYGHGAVAVARIALEFGARYLAVATTDEGLELRQNDIVAPVLVFGERTPAELEECVRHELTCFVNDVRTAKQLARLAEEQAKRVPVHVEVDTGLSRYGVRWTKALEVLEIIHAIPALQLQGLMSHFAMSDEQDKTFALEQLRRFQEVLAGLGESGIRVTLSHMCNSGGYLDLPQGHFNMVRMGILPLGVYPSQVCRRISGLQPVMSVTCEVAALQEIEAGDYVGYGMRYQAGERRRIAVLPLGYGDGFPRVRNAGSVLIRGKRAPVVGGNAMDAMMVDVTDIPETEVGDNVVVMGKDGEEEIDVHELARLKGSVSYDILAGWRSRLPRVYLNENSRS